MCSAPTSTAKETETSKPAEAAPKGASMMVDSNDSAVAALDPMTCSAHKLAEYLVSSRFEKDPEKAVTFLQAALNNAKTRVASGVADASASSQEEADLGSALTVAAEMSIVTPRAGKYQITLHEGGLSGIKSISSSSSAAAAAPKLVIPKKVVQQVICFPKPEDCREATGKKKNGSDMVLMTLEPPIMFNNKPVHQITLQLPWEKTEGALKPKVVATAAEEDSSSTEDATDLWCRFLIQSLGDQIEVSRVTRNKMGNDFTSFEPTGSSSTTAAMPFVRCYSGVQDGALYPLEAGLLFFKPPRFIPRSTLHSIACGRGSSSSNSSRYVDMIIKLQDGSDVEFSNIQREELGVLNNYIHKVLIPAMQQEAAASPEKKKKKDSNSSMDDKKTSEDGESTEEEEEVEAVAVDEDDDDDDDSDISDEEDDKYNPEMDSEGEQEGDSDEDDGDEDGDDDFEIVQDDFAKELVKQKKNDDSTESEDDEEEGIRSRSKRRRTV